MIHATLVHYQHHEVSSLCTDLQPPASTGDGNRSRSTPAVRRSAGSDTLAVATTKSDCDIHHRWDHDDTLGVRKNVLWDPFIRRSHDLVENMSRVIEPFGDVRFCL